MEEIMRQNVAIERVAAQAREQALVEGEVALPGGIREEATVLGCEARLVISGVEPQQDRLAMDGAVVFQVLYRQGGDEVRVLEANCAFSHQADLPGVDARMRPQVRGTIQSATAQPVSGRMRLRAVTDLSARVFAPEETEIVAGIQKLDALQTDETDYELLRHAASGTASALLREEFALDAGLPIAETLYARAAAQVSSVSGGEGRATVEGNVFMEVFHAGSDPETPLVVTEHNFPFEHTVDLQGEPGDDLRASVQVQDVVASSVDAGDGTRVLRTETVLDIEAESFAPQTLHTLRDAYTLAGDRVALDTRAVNCLSGITALEARETDKQVLPLPADAPPVGRVLAAILTPTATGAEQVGGRVIVEGLLDSQIIYVPAGQTAAVGARQEAPFRIAFQGALPADAAIRLTASNVQAEGISPDRVEVKYVMALDADVISEAAVQLPEGVEKTEAEPERGGLIMVWPQRGETYWDIAKRLRVTVDSIKHLNPSAAPGQALVVMKKGEEGY